MADVLLTTMQVASLDDSLLAPLHERGHALRLNPFPRGTTEDELIAVVGEARAVIAGVEPYTPRVLATVPNVEIIARTGVGYDAIDIDAANGRGIYVTTTPGANHHSVAEAAIGFMLAATRRVAHADRQMRSTGWNPRPYGVELRNKTIGIVGTGLIGKEVVRRLQGWDVNILLSDVVQDPTLEQRYGARYVDFDTLVHEADVITLHAPLLPSTHHLINETVLRAMKPTAFLVNTARGPLVDEAALARALTEGWIAGAALDVFEAEPLPAASPLIGIPNITLSQHVAGVTFESMRAMVAIAVDNVVAVLDGKPALHPVNTPGPR
jgi:phosphoglycerate dehydrogenase-like enzyme